MPLLACLELVALLTLVITRGAGYTDHVDFHPSDELDWYLAAGRDMHRAGLLPHFAMSPLSSLAYCALDALPFGRWPSMDAMYWLCLIGAPVLLWWSLRPLLVAPLPLVVAAWFGTSVRLLQADHIGTIATTHVYPFTLAIVFAALGACARRRFVWTLVLAALAAVNRTELWPWFAAFGLALCWSQSTGWSRRRRWQLALGVVGTTACAGLAPGVADKAWMTFRQHYAAAAVREDLLGEATTTPARTVDVEWAAFRAFHEPDARVAIDFPAAKSVPEALVENPERFLAHVWRNVRAIPASLVSAQVTTLFPRAFAVGLIAALVAAAACGSWLRRGAGSTWPLPVWLLLVASPLAIAPSTIAAARGELLWPLFPAWAVPIAGGISKLLANRPLRFLRTVAPLALLATAFAVPGPFAKPPSPLQHRDVLELLTMHPPLPGARMVCAWPGYPELIDRRDVMAFSSAYLPFTLDPGIGMQGDLVVSTPDLARQEPKLAEIAAEIVRSGHWRLVGSVGVATLYARVPRGR